MPAAPERMTARVMLVRVVAVVTSLALVPRVAPAQTAIIEGRVAIAPSGRAADAAELRIEGTALTTVTDTAGRYRIGPVPPGPQVLVVRKIGYAPARIPLTVPASGVVTQDVTLAASKAHQSPRAAKELCRVWVPHSRSPRHSPSCAAAGTGPVPAPCA